MSAPSTPTFRASSSARPATACSRRSPSSGSSSGTTTALDSPAHPIRKEVVVMGRKRSFLAAVVCFLVVLVTASVPAVAKTVIVKCNKGDSIQAALEDKADPLVIEV